MKKIKAILLKGKTSSLCNHMKNNFGKIKDFFSKSQKEYISHLSQLKKKVYLNDKDIKNKSKRIIPENINKMFMCSLFFTLVISFIPIVDNFSKNETNISYITLRIKDTGLKSVYGFLYSDCFPLFPKPNEVYINNIKQDEVKIRYNFNETNNEIILIWNETVINCNCLFLGCKDIYDINFSNFDTSEVTTMFAMFYECYGLKSLDLSHFDTSKVGNMSWMFVRCESLISLNLSGFNTSQVKSMASFFDTCLALKSLDLSHFDTSKVNNMNRMFVGCESLISLNLSSFNTSQVKNMVGMFSSCSSLELLDISYFNTSEVRDMENMFSFCKKLTFLNISNFDVSKVTNMFQMFCECNELEYLDLSNFSTDIVSNINLLFLNCHSLKSLNLSKFNTSRIENMKYLFYRCSSLNLLDLSNFDTSQVTNMEYMFLGCSLLQSLYISNFNTSKVENMYAMFYNCSSLISLDVSNFNTSKVTNMDFIFGYCSSLTSLDLSNFDTSNLITMESMFEGCLKLTSLNLFKFKTSKVSIMYYMFNGCSSLTSLDLSNFDTSSVNDMESMFDNCLNLEYINLKNASIQQNNINLNNIFSKTALNLVVCTSDIILIEKVKENECAIIDCSENWKENRKKIIIGTNTCVNNCTFLNDSFEYDSKCYKNCPSDTYRNLYFDFDINNYNIGCINSTEGYYLDKDDLFYKKCFSSCKTCDEKGDDVNHNCLECKHDYIFRNNFWNYSNCYNICLNYLYFDNKTNSLRCTDNLECPKIYNKLILDKKECIDNCTKDLNYKFGIIAIVIIYA